MKEIIKRHKNKNEYLLVGPGMWVRNFTKKVEPVDINNLTSRNDYNLMIENEVANRAFSLPSIYQESFDCREAVVVSDGLDFDVLHKKLESLPKRVKVVCVNHALLKWSSKRMVDFFVVNNPYAECLSCLPKEYFPPCIASSRTNPNFVRRYLARRGTVYRYQPVPEERFSANLRGAAALVDDYRNPVCAAVALLHHFGVEKLLLACCDDVFRDERPGSTPAGDGLWAYPQHQTAVKFIGGCLRWLSRSPLPFKAGSFGAAPIADPVGEDPAAFFS